jgi:calcineurin-like phosphoesterase family protein
MLWFTSDTHFGHANVIIHDKRPFHAPDCSCVPATETERGRGCRACADLMDEELIMRWNAYVGRKDDVWHLGDFAYRSEKPAEWYLKKLNGRIHIIFGNHDLKGGAKGIADQFASYYGSLPRGRDEHGPSWSASVELKHDHQLIVMGHYSGRTWFKSHRGAWHLFGHSHGKLPNYHRSMDVGVACHDYRPISYDEVRAYMERQPVTPHHPEAD